MPSKILWPRVIGQRRVKESLLSALRSGRMAHAYLFYGGEGVGKDATALELARVLHCEKGGEEACGACSSCRRLETLQHPDVHFVVALPVGKNEQSDDTPLAKLSEAEVKEVQEQYRLKGADPYHTISISRANIIKINSIRDIRREASMSSFGTKRKIFILSHADQMGDDAANTLLKTLEEPSGDTLLILTTANRDALLPTILSRCQNVRFDRLTEDEIRQALVTRKGVDEDRAALVARLANGSYSRAIELLSDDVLQWRRDVLAFIRHAVGGNVMAVSADIEKVTEQKDRETVNMFLVFILMWFRDALVLSRGGTIINLDQEQDLGSFVSKFPHADLVRVMAEVERAIRLIDRNVLVRLVLTNLAVQLKSIIITGRP